MRVNGVRRIMDSSMLSITTVFNSTLSSHNDRAIFDGLRSTRIVYIKENNNNVKLCMALIKYVCR